MTALAVSGVAHAGGDAGSLVPTVPAVAVGTIAALRGASMLRVVVLGCDVHLAADMLLITLA